ncbi:MAG: T9SS type A sorting domain-containing protein [Bacteroidales bacterium]|nr:T9SS type A sorting domain-containing protein [Candidatus Colimorpha onthohippi]
MEKLIISLSILALTLLPFEASWGQGDARLSSFSTIGATVVNAMGSYSYTVGQTAFAYTENNDGSSLTEGVQQIFCVPTFTSDTIHTCQYALLGLNAESTPSITTNEVGEFDHLIHYYTNLGCDSIVYLHLVVHPHQDTDIYVQSSLSYEWYGQQYEALGDYEYTDRTMHGCDSNITLHLSISNEYPIPEIYVYQEKVLVVNHNPEGFSNVRFLAYRWYRNDELIDGASQDYYQDRSGNELKGCFYLEVPTDASMQHWLRSNTICVGQEGIDNVDQLEISLTLSPNPVLAGQMLRVAISAEQTDLNGAKLLVYDVQGRQMIEQKAEIENMVQANFSAGVYSVHVLLSDGRHAARKLVVR